MSCGGILSKRDMASLLLVAGIPGGLCIPIRYHACNIARPRRFGFTGFVIYTTFFVELICHSAWFLRWSSRSFLARWPTRASISLPLGCAAHGRSLSR
jgi:hypothetical protein